MTATKNFLIILTFGIIFQAAQAKIILVIPGDNLNEIINNANGGDSVVVRAGTYSNVILSDKKYSEKKPLVIMKYGSDTVLVSGNTISKGCSLEVNNCNYIIIEGLTFINSMWGIYVKGSEHIIIRNNEIYNTGQEGCHISHRTSGIFNSHTPKRIIIYVGFTTLGKCLHHIRWQFKRCCMG